MTESSYSSRSSSSDSSLDGLRRQPKQQRGKERVERILAAAATVFDEMGYDAATTHLIAAKADTSIGSLYQFFPDKAAIFKAMELRHLERVQDMWEKTDIEKLSNLPLRQMAKSLVSDVVELFAHPVSRVIFVQFFTAREIFQSIDEGLTQEAINFIATLLRHRNPALGQKKTDLLAEVCVHSINAVILVALRNPDVQHQRELIQQIEELLVSYLDPHFSQGRSDNVMKVMKCIHCRSRQISKNGRRRGKQCYICRDCGRQFVERQASQH